MSKYTYTAAYIGVIVAANWATSTFGLVSLGLLGLAVTAGTFFAYAPDVNVPKVRRWINDHTYLLLWDAVYQRDEWAALEGRVDE